MQLFAIQMFEWRAMLYLIKTQKDKSLGQILYDHNSENVRAPLEKHEIRSKQRISRRREIRLKKQFRFESVLMTAALLFLVIFGFFDLGLCVLLIIGYTLLLYLAILSSFL